MTPTYGKNNKQRTRLRNTPRSKNFDVSRKHSLTNDENTNSIVTNGKRKIERIV